MILNLAKNIKKGTTEVKKILKKDILIWPQNPVTFTALQDNSKLVIHVPPEHIQSSKINYSSPYLESSTEIDLKTYANGDIKWIPTPEGEKIAIQNLLYDLDSRKDNAIRYRKNNGNWVELGLSNITLVSYDSNYVEISLNLGDTVQIESFGKAMYGQGLHFRYSVDMGLVGDINGVWDYEALEYLWKAPFKNSTGKFNVSGDLISLVGYLYNNLTLFSFAYLFEGIDIVSVSDLIFPKVGIGGYACMFKGCTSLQSMPQLDNTGGSHYLFFGMFQGCTSLNSILKQLYYTTMDNVYSFMFANCSSLQNASNFNISSSLGKEACKGMFYGCSSLSLPPTIQGNTLNYRSRTFLKMFYECINLPTTIELPSTIGSIGEYGYSLMYEGCTNLSFKYNNGNGSLTLGDVGEGGCYRMFARCLNLNLNKLILTKSSEYSYLEMFYGAGNIRAVNSVYFEEEDDEYKTLFSLPTRLEYGCCLGMFKYCNGIEGDIVINTSYLGIDCLKEMFCRGNNSSAIQSIELRYSDSAPISGESIWSNIVKGHPNYLITWYIPQGVNERNFYANIIGSEPYRILRNLN